MKRTAFYLVIAAFAVFSTVMYAACQKKEPNAAITATPSPSGEITIRLLTHESGIDDKSFNAAAWRGILDFYGDTWDNTSKRGRLYDFITTQSQDMYVPNLRQATDEGYDLIVATGFNWAASLAQVAGDNPRQKYMIVDAGGFDLHNVMQAVYTEHVGSYLVGVAAAMKAKEDNIPHPQFGFIGGVPNPTITKFEVGYVQGILSIIPDAQIVDYYVNSFDDPALAKNQARNWYNTGVYTIYSAAGNSGNGTIAQAKEQRIAGKNVWAIGVDSDQYAEGLYNDNESAVLTSMLKLVENSLVYALNAVKNNTFSGEITIFGLAQNGVGYSTANDALSPDIVAYLENVKQKIISGEIVVAATIADAKRLPGFPQNLKITDD